MPRRMSTLVLHPRISTSTDWKEDWVNVSVGGTGEKVRVGSGVSVFVGVTGKITVTPGAIVLSNVGGDMMKGVAVTMLGVIVGMGVQTGNG